VKVKKNLAKINHIILLI